MFWATGCHCESVDASRLVGKYTFSEMDLDISLSLEKDSNCTQTVTNRRTGERQTFRGVWEYDLRTENVILTGMFVSKSWKPGAAEMHFQLSSALQLLPVRCSWGTITLGSDEGELYKRIQ